MAQIPDAQLEIGEIKPMKWEYDIYHLDNHSTREKILEILDAYGSNGWELIAISNDFLWFKRPIWNPE